jgi:hypothetical protein
VLGQRAVEERAVANVAAHQGRRRRHRPVETGAEIVDHDDRPILVEQCEYGVAADIAGAAGDEDGEFLWHVTSWLVGAPMPQGAGLLHPERHGTRRGTIVTSAVKMQ